MLGPVTAQLADLVDDLAKRGPAVARPYVELVAEAALANPSPLASPERVAWVMTGIIMRESGFGTSRDLDIKGPGGTGDFGARHRRPDPSLFRVPAVYQGLSNIPDAHGRVYVLALDGRGWGRGLSQIDWEKQRARVQRLLADGTPAWKDPRYNIDAGTAVYVETLAALGVEREAIAGYNCGPGGVRAALTAGQDIDANTTGHEYSMWVGHQLLGWSQAAPWAEAA